MAFPVDPMRCIYPPEVFAEAGLVSTSLSGTQIADYGNYYDKIVQLVTLGTMPMTATTGSVRVNTDAGDNKVNSVVEARPYMNHIDELNITGITSMTLFGYYPAGGSAGDLLYRYGIRVTTPTVFEKLLYNIQLTDEEKALDTKFGISKGIAAGTLTGKAETQFSKIFEVARSIDVAADVDTTVDRVVHPLAGQKVVLLGLAIEEYDTTPNIMYLSVKRDNEQVMKLDAHAFADSVGGSMTAENEDEMNYEMPCYVNALDRLEVYIESSVAKSDVRVRFRYGIAKLTIIDKIRWNLPLSDEDNVIASEMDLYDSVKAGVL